MVEFSFAFDKLHSGVRVQTCQIRQDSRDLLTVWLNQPELMRLFLAHWQENGEEIELACLNDDGRFLMIANGKTVTFPTGTGSNQASQDEDRIPTTGPIDPAAPPRPDEDMGSIADSL